jgi:diguanylate cyclase
MRYQQSAAQSAELLRLILPRIGLHGGQFTPSAYAVWYEYLAGVNAALSDALDARLRQGNPLTHSEIVALYVQHIQSREMRSLTQLQAGLGELLRKLGDIAVQSGKGAAEYYRALAAHEQELASIVDADTLRGVLQALKNSTASVRMSTAMLHTEIEAGCEQMQNLHAQLNTLQGEALTDPLTGLHNRRGFDRSSEQLYGAKDEAFAGAALLLVDIDHFKQINDTYGHLFGDQVLRAAARVIAESVKGRDVAARFGGDEFLVLLPETPVDGALAVAEQIRAAFSRARIRRNGSDTCIEQVTISAGVAIADPAETMEQLIDRADRTLYRAKAEGRNRVCVASRERSETVPPRYGSSTGASLLNPPTDLSEAGGAFRAATLT